jgi:hypothetical protein
VIKTFTFIRLSLTLLEIIRRIPEIWIEFAEC